MLVSAPSKGEQDAAVGSCRSLRGGGMIDLQPLESFARCRNPRDTQGPCASQPLECARRGRRLSKEAVRRSNLRVLQIAGFDTRDGSLIESWEIDGAIQRAQLTCNLHLSTGRGSLLHTRCHISTQSRKYSEKGKAERVGGVGDSINLLARKLLQKRAAGYGHAGQRR